MSEKKIESDKRAISRMLRQAFNAAEIGDRDRAIFLWECAIQRGYAPNPKTQKGLEITIRKGFRDTRPGEPVPSGLGRDGTE